jgi:glycosyltransferase involved in cell wall biosynthesis
MFYRSAQASVRPVDSSQNARAVDLIDHLPTEGAQRLLTAISVKAGGAPAQISDLKGTESIVFIDMAPEADAIRRAGVDAPAGLSGWIRFIGRLRRMSGQIVHFQRPDGIIPGVPIARLFGKRVVVTLHMPYARRQDSLLGLLAQRVETVCLRHFVDCVVAVGDSVLASQKPRIGSARQFILPTLVAPRRPMRTGARAAIRHELGVGERQIVLLATGGLTSAKDPMTLLSAFAQVRQGEPNAVLWITGDGALRDRLEMAVDCLGVRDSVSFLGNRRDTTSVIRAADIFVLSSQLDGAPAGLIEAMALGLAPVATRVGDVPTIIRPGAGLVVEAQNPKVMAEAILRLCADPVLRSRMARAAVRSVQPFMNVEAWHRSMAAIYADVARDPPGAPDGAGSPMAEVVQR